MSSGEEAQVKPEKKEVEEEEAKKEILAERITGKVKWFNVKSGYGFITRNDTGEDIFIHQTAISKNNPRKLKRSVGDNEEVLFDVVSGVKGNEAFNVTGPDGAPVKGSIYARDRRPRGRGGFRGGSSRGEGRGSVRGGRPRRRRSPSDREGDERVSGDEGEDARGSPEPRGRDDTRRERRRSDRRGDSREDGRERGEGRDVEYRDSRARRNYYPTRSDYDNGGYYDSYRGRSRGRARGRGGFRGGSRGGSRGGAPRGTSRGGRGTYYRNSDYNEYHDYRPRARGRGSREGGERRNSYEEDNRSPDPENKSRGGARKPRYRNRRSQGDGARTSETAEN